MSDLENQILAWAEEKGIFNNGSPLAQAIKTTEEAVEVLLAVHKGNREAILDELGDVYVTIILQAKMQGASIEECGEIALKKISKRKGKMVNGIFVKDGN